MVECLAAQSLNGQKPTVCCTDIRLLVLTLSILRVFWSKHHSYVNLHERPKLKVISVKPASREPSVLNVIDKILNKKNIR